jgi:hypothetical protein
MAEIERAAQLAFAAPPSLTESIAASLKRTTESLAGFERLWGQSQPISDLYSRLIKSLALEQLPALRSASIAAQLPEFDSTFLGSLRKRLEELHESGVGVEPAVAELDSAIKEHAERLGPSWVNYKGMWGLLYPLLLALLQLWYSKISEERSSIEMQRFIESQFRATEAQLALQLQGLRPPESPETIYVVGRQCYIRTDRFAKATAIGVLYPYQVVEVRKTSGKWAYIEFFDHVSGIPRTGWILKKYVTTMHLRSGRVQHLPIKPDSADRPLLSAAPN